MHFENSHLPWTGAAVRRCEHVSEYLAERLPGGWGRYLPATITLFADPEISEAAAMGLLQSMAEYLGGELERRRARASRFAEAGLMTENELEAVLTQRRDRQPWAIYYSGNGGLAGGQNGKADASQLRGVIPCSSMQNHGVAWEQGSDGQLRTWLATSRREGQAWDWESDIGHESAHAAFAQVPFFVQSSPKIPEDVLSCVEDPAKLSSLQIAQVLYMWSELAVVAVRGERRPTATGLPVGSPKELAAMLRVSRALSDDAGFERAERACAAAGGRIDVNEGDGIFEIGAPILRGLPRVSRFTNLPEPPTLAELREALGGLARRRQAEALAN